MPAQHLIDVAYARLMAEGEADLDGAMASFEGEPVYELFPVGRRMRGMDAARRYYRHFFAEVLPRLVNDKIIVHGNSVTETGLINESTLVYRHDDGAEQSFRVLGILVFGEKAVTGERIFADEAFLRVMFGPLWDEMEPIEG